jgi:hypothetical protein
MPSPEQNGTESAAQAVERLLCKCKKKRKKSRVFVYEEELYINHTIYTPPSDQLYSDMKCSFQTINRF